MLSLAIRLVAIGACFLGIAACARIGDDVLSGEGGVMLDSDKKIESAGTKSTAALLRLPKLLLKIGDVSTPYHHHHHCYNSNEYLGDGFQLTHPPWADLSTLLLGVVKDGTRIFDAFVRHAIPSGWPLLASGTAAVIDGWHPKPKVDPQHWTASRTQIHPAIA